MAFSITWLVLVSLVLTSQAQEGKNQKNRTTAKWGDKYNFIVIGGGTAGTVLSRRLAEVPTWKILLLEAGNTTSFLSSLPAVSPFLQLNPQITWKYFSEAQNDTFWGMKKGKIPLYAGRVLGGTSTINYMVYTRGNKEDFDRWGQKGWSYNEVLPYFLKSEQSNLEISDDDYHGKTGPIPIEHSFTDEETGAVFFQAAKEMGYKMTDYNGQNQTGFSKIQATINKGRRSSVSDTYLETSKLYPNLEILQNAYVIRIGINRNGTKARRVVFIKDGTTYHAQASDEIILSAGVFRTPQLLMLSGIGPEKHLTSHGINCVRDLPVGQSLTDHVVYPGLNFVTGVKTTYTSAIGSYVTNAINWMSTGDGAMASLGGFQGIGFVPLAKSGQAQNRPDLEVLFHNNKIQPTIKQLTNMKDSVYKKLYNRTAAKIQWSIFPVLLHPKSRGQVELKSKNPMSDPLIRLNYFQDPDDLKTMIEGIKFVMKLTRTQDMKKINTTLNQNLVPGCENRPENSDSYWECALRTLATSSHDQYGTCKMGGKNDAQSVVDPKLKVRGLKNLRVVDASVIPDGGVSGHLMAATVMIAERAADFIKQARKSNDSVSADAKG